MRLCVALVLLSGVQFKACCVAPAPVATKERIAELVQQLGNRRFAKRESAEKLLKEVGEPALDALRATLETTDDIEVKRRAANVIVAILKNIKPSDSTGMEMVVIEPGKYKMGSPGAEKGRRSDERQHRVHISDHFLMGKHEVTQVQYQFVMKLNPSGFWNSGPKAREKRYPVEQVSWFDAIDFCNRLSKLDGFKPYYTLTEVKRKEQSIISAKVAIAGGHGYRLPTEAEWEYACRAGASTPFFFGARNTGKQSNVKASRRAGAYGSTYLGWKDHKKTTHVGSYPPNRWGLYDMLGNVGEWVQDWYDKDYYANSPEKNPTGPAEGRHRVLRGGSWLVTEDSARSASRFYQTPDERKNYTGFRVARTP